MERKIEKWEKHQGRESKCQQRHIPHTPHTCSCDGLFVISGELYNSIFVVNHNLFDGIFVLYHNIFDDLSIVVGCGDSLSAHLPGGYRESESESESENETLREWELESEWEWEWKLESESESKWESGRLASLPTSLEAKEKKVRVWVRGWGSVVREWVS